MLFRVVFIHPGHFLDFSSSWCTSSRLFALRPGSFWSCMYLIRVVFYSSGPFLDFSGSWCTSSRLFALRLGSFWSCMYLFQVVCTSSGFFLNLYVPYPCCFLINPGSSWICLGTCSTSSGLFYDRSGFFLDLSWYLPYLVGVLFWSIRVVSGLALRSVFSWSHGTDVAPLHVKHKNML